MHDAMIDFSSLHPLDGPCRRCLHVYGVHTVGFEGPCMECGCENFTKKTHEEALAEFWKELYNQGEDKFND
jgi:predicted  nucleic acid-binding Zn-ribbon protein